MNQVNTSACCNDDYDECNPHDISVLNVPKGTMPFDTNTKSKTSKKNERTHVPLPKELAQTQGLKIGCLNIRGLLSKIDEVKMILDECNFDIMGVCETFIDSNVSNNEISIYGYSIVKKNINRHGGGVSLYVKDCIDYSEITELVSEQVESVWIKLMYKKMLGVVYRPPSSNNDYFNCVLNQIYHAHSLNENIILMGDLNYNYKFDESLSCNTLHQIEVLYNMRQLITSPTRVTLTTSTLIDVLFTNDHNSHVMTGVYGTALSDNYLIYTVFSKKFCKERTCTQRNKV